jgi:hypothetical protein
MTAGNTNILLWKMFCDTFGLGMQPESDGFTSGVPEPAIFGIFATIHREKSIVHGCQGHIDRNLSAMDPDKVVHFGVRSAINAAFHDPRNINFKEPIHMDPWAEMSVSFMLLPVENDIGAENTNDEYGLICQSNGNLTTFLPDVFPGERLKQIQKKLAQKAGTASCDIFYKYRVIEETAIFGDLMMHTFQRSKVALEQYLDKYFDENDFIFYSVDTNGLFTVNEKEMIRNLACIHLFKKFNLSTNSKNKLEENKIFYKKWDTGNIQEKIAVRNHRNNTCQIGTFEKISDTKFTLGQYGIHYAANCKGEPSKKLAELLRMRDKIAGLVKNIRHTNADHAFSLNWYTQFLAHFLKFIYVHSAEFSAKNAQAENGRSEQQIELIERAAELFWLLASRVLSVADSPEFVGHETNFIAVLFEALCFLRAAHKKLKNMGQIFLGDPSIGGKCVGGISTCIKKKIFFLFLCLEQRKHENTQYCLYSFNDAHSRLDITAHVWTGILLLQKKKHT